MLSQPLALAEDEAHIWLLPTSNLRRVEVRAIARLLSNEERRRSDEFALEAARSEFVIARAFVRSVISRYLGLSPEVLVFETSALGKPELRAPSGTCRIEFNLSHTAGLTACGVARSAWVGVDVESLSGRHADAFGIAKRFFAPREWSSLSSLPIVQRKRRFCELWTLKEAYAKALGMGLSLPLDETCFEFRDGGEVQLEVDIHRVGAQFCSFAATPRHAAALALIPPRPGRTYRLCTRSFTAPWWPAEP